jgi:hypothetical protein
LPVEGDIEMFDPAERERAKQAAREQDDADLRNGRVSVDEMQKRNGFFSGLDFSKASIRRGRK